MDRYRATSISVRYQPRLPSRRQRQTDHIPSQDRVAQGGHQRDTFRFLLSTGSFENISAVLFSASGTISKFNRIGRQSGYRHPDVTMVRMGTCHDQGTRMRLCQKCFRYVVDETCDETWGRGTFDVSTIRGPHILYPRIFFPSIAHHRFVEGQIASHLPEFHPFPSSFYIEPTRDALVPDEAVWEL